MVFFVVVILFFTLAPSKLWEVSSTAAVDFTSDTTGRGSVVIIDYKNIYNELDLRSTIPLTKSLDSNITDLNRRFSYKLGGSSSSIVHYDVHLINYVYILIWRQYAIGS